MIKLYYAPRTRSTRPRWLLEELGVPYEAIRVDIAKSEHKKAEYLAIHPHGLVPALDEDGKTMIESLAICLYLADKFPEKGFAPAVGSPERGEYYQWMFYAAATIEPELVRYFINAVAGTEETRDREEAEAARRKFDEIARVLKKALAGKDFIVANQISTADIVLGSMLAWGRSMGLLKDHWDLENYVKTLTERPAFRRAQS
jgi:glutathione S-transferase